MACKRKLWTAESMENAVKYVNDEGKGLREAARAYNVPVETLRRRVTGAVSIDCRPGPPTVFTMEEESMICDYLITMADMGYGLSRDTVMTIAFKLAEKLNKTHPFTGDSAGRSWFDGFKHRHPQLTIRTPLPLSYSRAVSANVDTVNDFFGKVGSIYGRLNLISKPMCIFNCDETGVTIVHRPGKVVTQMGRKTVYSVSSAERGKTHTVLACVSASGIIVPPMIVYPRKREIPNSFKNGAVPNTYFAKSENGWINSSLFLEWLKFFVASIPPARPVLLIQDGHSSHISIEAIEYARTNNIHLLCLPSHTTHILQPLDVGVFKSFKSNFSKACTNFIAKNPGQVITNDLLASLIGISWNASFTIVNIMSGFKKCGLYPFNPSAVDDRRMAPSRAFFPPPAPSESVPGTTLVLAPPSNEIEKETQEINDKACVNNNNNSDDQASLPSSPIFTSEQEALYQKRYKEEYDLLDPSYVAWLRINHPERAISVTSTGTPSDTSVSTSSHNIDNSNENCSETSGCGSSVYDLVKDVLVLPKPKVPKKKRQGLNSKAVCITDMLEEMKEQEQKKEDAKREKEEKKKEKEEKRKNKLEEQEVRKKEREEKKRLREIQKEEKKKEREAKKKTEKETLCIGLAELALSDEEEDTTQCPICNLFYKDDESSNPWVCCDGCDTWFDFKCTSIRNPRRMPKSYYCKNC